MKKKGYMEHMNEMFANTNRKALRYGDGWAWDNKKKKTMRLQGPRGKVYHKLNSIAWKTMHSNLRSLNNELKGHVKRSKGDNQ